MAALNGPAEATSGEGPRSDPGAVSHSPSVLVLALTAAAAARSLFHKVAARRKMAAAERPALAERRAEAAENRSAESQSALGLTRSFQGP